MDSANFSLAMFDQNKLTPEARDAALAAAFAVLSREGVAASDAVAAYRVDLLLAEGLAPDERTDDHFRDHGASLHAAEAYCAAREAAEAAIAQHDPANAGFRILFSLAD